MDEAKLDEETEKHPEDLERQRLQLRCALSGLPWGRQRNEDGLQLRWLLPTELFVGLGAELGRGNSPKSIRVNLGGLSQALRAVLPIPKAPIGE